MFDVAIIESSRELTKKECVKIKTSNTSKIADIVGSVITPKAYVILKCKVDDKEPFDKLIIFTDDETYSTTGSVFISTFKDMWADMDGEPFDIRIVKGKSKKYDTEFINCEIV